MVIKTARMCLKKIFVLSLLMIWGSQAWAGNLWLSGHDMDYHCWVGAGQCNYIGVATNYIRQNAPTKTLPILVLDSGTEVQGALSSIAAKARNAVEGAGNPFSITIVDPSGSAFATTPIDVSHWSAIVIASDSTCGGCDNSVSDITAINSRTSDIQAFFNAGGGLLYLAGAGNRDTYYNSVPVPTTAVAVAPPFSVTAAGTALGVTNDDANCCETHNSFVPLAAGSAFQVLETDNAGNVETIIASSAAVCGGKICSTYTIGGTVSGLSGTGLVLSLNSGAQTLSVSASGGFTFPSALADASTYAVIVSSQPSTPAQTCTVSNGSATLTGANITNVAVVCTSATSTYVVTPSAGANGAISPTTAQTVAANATATFTVTPNPGFSASVAGTCGGTLAGTTYTTSAVTADCTVIASFTAVGAISPTTTVLSATPNPAKVGQPLGLTASVSVGAAKSLDAHAKAATALSGNVTFTADGNLIGTVALGANGQATLAAGSLAVGSHVLVAAYSGDANDSASASAPVNVSVLAAVAPVAAIPTPALSLWAMLALSLGFIGLALALRGRGK